MSKIIPTERVCAYLRTLAETGNATLAAERARVSRSWAYARRKADARFDRLCREMAALARARLPARVNRDRAGGWSAAKEARFIARLQETGSVWLAAAEVGLSTVSAYRHREVRPAFAADWDEAQRLGWPPTDEPWIESAICFLDGEAPPPGQSGSVHQRRRGAGRDEGEPFRPPAAAVVRVVGGVTRSKFP